MGARKMPDLLLMLAGLIVLMVAWSKHAYWWVLFGGLLLIAGFWLGLKYRRASRAAQGGEDGGGWVPGDGADDGGDGGDGGGD
ncbi:hypothetical protein [Massilia sp. MS-15]|uniref:hypothetical protein n=1 Tax=Massilia sp. MS-15 TaxID=2878200 RepID=UPI001CD1C85F|nr:hypothetical protein [Massilia sp. MS-15]MCA1246272.1 hypothetical protein [Massilia sp. MS-15]